MEKATWRIEDKITGKRYVLNRCPKIFISEEVLKEWKQACFGLDTQAYFHSFLHDEREKYGQEWYSADELYDIHHLCGFWMNREEAEFMASDQYLQLRKEVMFMVNVSRLKDYLQSPGCFGEQYSNIGPIIVLSDMNAPVSLNAGHVFTKQKLDIRECNSEADIARKLIPILQKSQHNAFAFYRFADGNLEYGSIRIG